MHYSQNMNWGVCAFVCVLVREIASCSQLANSFDLYTFQLQLNHTQHVNNLQSRERATTIQQEEEEVNVCTNPFRNILRR
jgi:hypothetical protein